MGPSECTSTRFYCDRTEDSWVVGVFFITSRSRRCWEGVPTSRTNPQAYHHLYHPPHPWGGEPLYKSSLSSPHTLDPVFLCTFLHRMHWASQKCYCRESKTSTMRSLCQDFRRNAEASTVLDSVGKSHLTLYQLDSPFSTLSPQIP